MLYTGQQTMTGGRLLEAKDFIGNERFMLTSGDGVSDVNIHELIKSHEQAGKYVTLTSVRPAGRFGALSIDVGGAVTSFKEKPDGDGAWINGGFFVMEPQIYDYITEGDATILERSPLEQLAKAGQLNAYKHDGFWQSMDTLKDKNDLTALWTTGKAPWALWQKTNA
jgi:glucose-1-phosphate cytidylyltransferase